MVIMVVSTKRCARIVKQRQKKEIPAKEGDPKEIVTSFFQGIRREPEEMQIDQAKHGTW